MKRLQLLLLSAFIISATLVGTALMSPVSVSAADECPDGVQTSFFGCVNQNKDSGNLADNPIYKLLLATINFLAFGVGIVVVGGIVWGSFLIINSNANAGRTQQGVSIIVNAFIGLLMYIFLFAIANYLVPGGLFN